ncbi:MAG: HupE/UreJ family protein [Pseudomonadales bacterium]
MQSLAHSRGESWSSVDIEGRQVNVTYIIQARELAQHLPDIAHSSELPRLLLDEITSKYQVIDDAGACKVSGEDFRQSVTRVQVAFLATCQAGRNITIRNDALFSRLPNHLHIARARIFDTDQAALKEKLFTGSDRVWQVTENSSLTTTLTRYLVLGIEHIATGYDHLAFLFAIILLSPRIITLILMITGFTVGHSITLALAVLGYASANSVAVEALIGFTIALVAAEVVARRHNLDHWLIGVTGTGLLALALLSHFTEVMQAGPNTLTLAGIAIFSVCYLILTRREAFRELINPTLTLLFGMIHGFGFAGLLIEIGLPPQQLVPALAGFNVGVEIGQLLILALVFGVGFALRHRVHLPALTTDAAASTLCGLGIFWFVVRSF